MFTLSSLDGCMLSSWVSLHSHTHMANEVYPELVRRHYVFCNVWGLDKLVCLCKENAGRHLEGGMSLSRAQALRLHVPDGAQCLSPRSMGVGKL